MPQSMRALVAGEVGEPIDVLRLESRPVPTPGAGQALIRVKATPIHASDLHVLRGRYGFSPEFPTVGGHMECVGRIEALGPDTEGLKIGERVVTVAVPAVPGPQVAGTWQEYLVADTQRLLPVPDRLSDSSACQLAVNPLTALLLMTRELDVKPGEWLLQTAAGSTVGRLVIQLSRHLGIRTINVVRRRVPSRRSKRSAVTRSFALRTRTCCSAWPRSQDSPAYARPSTAWRDMWVPRCPRHWLREGRSWSTARCPPIGRPTRRR